jgi:thiol-disulfide isomerase/thioredoxin
MRSLRLLSLLALLPGLLLSSGTRAEDVPAPEIARPGLQWFNTAAPIPIASLRGRIVLLDFWTEGCINCIHIIPTLKKIEERFPDKVAVIGVHSPKFANERQASSVEDAIQRYEIHHPIVHDPTMSIWRAYGIEAWPTLVIIGADGNILGQVSGEPDPDRAMKAIGQLVDDASTAGTLKPEKLALSPEPLPTGRYRFPGKLKPIPGSEKRWALADGGHHQIVVLDDAGKELKRYGSGTAGLVDGSAATAEFNRPQGLVADKDAIYVADTENHAIRRIDLASGAVTTLAGIGKRGQDLGSAAPGKTTELASPWDIVKSGTLLIFANAGTHQLGALDLATGKVRRFAGTGEEALRAGGAEGSAFAQPSGLALSADGKTLFVADSESSAIRKVSLDGEVETLVGKGLFEFGWINGNQDDARLQHPLGVAADGNDVLVADTYNSAIRSIDLKQHTVSDFDGGAYTCMDPVCIPTREPAGIVVDGPDRILLVDTGNHRIEEYTPSTKSYHTWSS